MTAAPALNPQSEPTPTLAQVLQFRRGDILDTPVATPERHRIAFCECGHSLVLTDQSMGNLLEFINSHGAVVVPPLPPLSEAIL